MTGANSISLTELIEQFHFHSFTVQTAHSSSCNSGGIAVDPDLGNLASHVTDTLHIGTASCPWNIEVGASQRIQLTALNFIDKQRRTVADTNKYRLSNICYKFAKVCLLHVYYDKII